MTKKFSFVICSMQSIILLLYFTTLLAIINPPDYILFPIWFGISFAGIADAIVLIAKKKLIQLSIVMLLLSFIILGIGALMRLFLTM